MNLKVMQSVVAPRFVGKLRAFSNCFVPRVLCAVSDRLFLPMERLYSLHTARVIGCLSFSEHIHISAFPLLGVPLPTLLYGTFLWGTPAPPFDLSFITPWLPNVFLQGVQTSGVEIHTPATRPLHPITPPTLGVTIYKAKTCYQCQNMVDLHSL